MYDARARPVADVPDDIARLASYTTELAAALPFALDSGA